jgi:threonyl-tRNA synthetase
MPTITLPDGSKKTFAAPVTGADVAASIGRRLAQAAVAVRVNGELKDLNGAITDDSAIEIVTRDSADGLEILRHDAAHVMAEAVQELYPETQVTIGPAIENGFYYDFARDEPFAPEDLARIEERMRAIVDRDEAIVREEWDRDEAVRSLAASASAIRRRSSRAFQRASRSACTGKAGSSIFAAGLTCRPPDVSGKHSS